MKQVIVEINGKKHGPLEVDVRGSGTSYITIDHNIYELDSLEALGAKIIEHKEPLRWSGPVAINGVGSLLINNPEEVGLSSWPDDMRCKRFHAVLTEIVEE